MKVEVGIDMGGTSIKIGLVHHGELIANTKVEASSHISLKERLVELESEINKLLAENDCTASGIGLAFPGVVDSDQNKILSKYVKYPDAQDTNLSRWAEDKWGVPLVLENDARAALVGEWQYGAGKNCVDLVLITLGTGVGTAVMINGQLFRGKHYLAGNLGGHMTINLNGVQCNCGNIGCLESESSTWALQSYVKDCPGFASSTLSLEKEMNFNAVFKNADNGDQLSINIKNNCLKAWALGIINLIHAYDPERLVMGGGIMKSKNVIIPYVKEMVKKHSWIPDGAIELVAAEQVEFAGILGVCHLVKSLIKESIDK